MEEDGYYGVEGKMVKETNYRRVLGIARDMLAEEGVERTTISKVAQSAEISKRTVFRYFGTKEQLISEVIRSGVEQMEKVVLQFVQRESYRLLTGREQVMELCGLVLDIIMTYSKEFIGVEEVEAYLIRTRNQYLQEQFESIYFNLYEKADQARKKGLSDHTINSMYKEHTTFVSFCKSLRGILYRAAIDVQVQSFQEEETEDLKQQYLVIIDKLLCP